jgi:hypothetical protein
MAMLRLQRKTSESEIADDNMASIAVLFEGRPGNAFPSKNTSCNGN